MGKKPFSSKLKKKQLQEKRQAKREEEVDEDGARIIRFKKHNRRGPTATGDYDRGVRINAQPTNLRNCDRDANRFVLHLQHRADTREELAARREAARVPYVRARAAQLCLTFEEVYGSREQWSRLGMPTRPHWNRKMSKHEVERHEQTHFQAFVQRLRANEDRERAAREADVARRIASNAPTPPRQVSPTADSSQRSFFEHNLETWRQLWRVIELSDVVLLITDVRAPILHFAPALFDYVTRQSKTGQTQATESSASDEAAAGEGGGGGGGGEQGRPTGRNLILVLNKIDLVPARLALAWKAYFLSLFPELHVVLFTSFPTDRVERLDELDSKLKKKLDAHNRRSRSAWGAAQIFAACQHLKIEKGGEMVQWGRKVREDAVRLAVKEKEAKEDRAREAQGQYALSRREREREREMMRAQRELVKGMEALETKPPSHTSSTQQNEEEDEGEESDADEFEAILSDDEDGDTKEALFQLGTIAPTEPARPHDEMVTVGLLGVPNVGKSSLLNGLVGRKVCSVSKTPGHTKHFQTIHLTPRIRLCDCPGLVFPSFVTRAVQILYGVFPIAQVREPYTAITYLAERVPLPQILQLTHPDDATLTPDTEMSTDGKHGWSSFGICEAWAHKRGFVTPRVGRLDTHRAGLNILQMTVTGQIVLAMRPPREFFEEEEEREWEREFARRVNVDDAEKDDTEVVSEDGGDSVDDEEDDEDDDEEQEEDGESETDEEEEEEEEEEEVEVKKTAPRVKATVNPFALLADEDD